MLSGVCIRWSAVTIACRLPESIPLTSESQLPLIRDALPSFLLLPQLLLQSIVLRLQACQLLYCTHMNRELSPS